jgi:hypothetical protein
MQNRVQTQIAEADSVVVNQTAKERMNRNAKTMEEVIFKHNQLISVGRWKWLTSCRTPPTGRPVGEDAVHHQAIQGRLTANRWYNSLSRLVLWAAFFELTRVFFGAIGEI